MKNTKKFPTSCDKFKENMTFWSGLYLKLDEILSNHLKQNEVEDFHIYMGTLNPAPNIIAINVIYNSYKDLSALTLSELYKGFDVEISFSKSGEICAAH